MSAGDWCKVVLHVKCVPRQKQQHFKKAVTAIVILLSGSILHIFEVGERKGHKAHWEDKFGDMMGRERKGRAAKQILNFHQ